MRDKVEVMDVKNHSALNVGVVNICTGKVRPPKVGLSKVGPGEVSATQIGLGEVSMAEVGIAEVGS
jgi:hypothetical protein